MLLPENLHISGHIPSEIGNLSQLTSLILESTFYLPSEIGMLSKLGKIMLIFFGMILMHLLYLRYEHVVLIILPWTRVPGNLL
jgi:hypothetical protein